MQTTTQTQDLRDVAAQDAREWENQTRAISKKLSEEKGQEGQRRASAVAAFDAIAGGNAFATEMRRAEGDINDRLFQANKRATKLAAEIETLRTQFVAQLAAKDARIAELEKEVKSERMSTARQGAAGKAVDLVASLGFRAINMEPDADGKTALEIYNSIKDPDEKGRYFAEHRERIILGQ